MEIKDLFDIQTLGDVRISPDGTSVAIVIQRAFSAPATFRPYNMFGNDQADIWIMPADGGPIKNITGGAKDGIGFWGPVWSPDGERLALLSTAGGDNVRAYLWTKRSGRLQRLSDRGVDMGVGTEAARSNTGRQCSGLTNGGSLYQSCPRANSHRPSVSDDRHSAWPRKPGTRQPAGSSLLLVWKMTNTIP
jgi:dipeptidyl aminopeptidase/acylaminoacyl peptidase